MLCFLQEIYRDDYKLWVQVILRNKVRLRLVYSWLLEHYFLFQKLVLPELILVYLGEDSLQQRY